MALSFDEVQKLLELDTLDFEGGYFKQIYKSTVPSSKENRFCGTSIYYALKEKNISRFHLVKSDEIWHYEAGTTAVQILLFPDGHHEVRKIGADLKNGERPQSIIPAGVWQAAALVDQSSGKWGLFGATCFPGFEFEDAIVKTAEELVKDWPAAEKDIKDANLWF